MTIAPSVVDQLVITNPSAQPLDVLAIGGEPYLRVSRDGVLGNLASRDWYATQTPEGGPPPPAGALGPTPRWARVSHGSSWAVFDSRIRPAIRVAPEIRKAAKSRILAAWKISIRYGEKPATVTGFVRFAPVLGALVVAVDRSPFTATALQGELPGLFARAPAGTEIRGSDGQPFLRFTGAEVLANTSSPSWREDRAARGEAVTGSGWVRAGRGSTFSWLDGRLRYPADQPADPARRAVLQHWSVPVVMAGRPGAITGTVTWVPRAEAVAALRPSHHDGFPWWVLAPSALAVLVVGEAARRRRHRT